MSAAQVDRSRGSLWHRWAPQIHAPHTAMNDQYKGAEPWADFATRVTYISGGLEKPMVREAVCAILEGGKRLAWLCDAVAAA